MTKPKIYDEFEAQKAVNEAIDDTSIEDDSVDQYFEAAIEVLTGKVQARSAASNLNLDLKKLESLLQLARKKLDVQPSKENKHPKKSNESNNEMDRPTSSSSLTEKPKNQEKGKKPGRPQKRKTEEEEIPKKRESKKKKKSDNIEENVTVRKKRRKMTDVLQQEAREQVFGGSNDADSEALALALKVLPPSPVKTRSKTLSSVNSLKALTWNDNPREYSPTTTASSSALVLYTKGGNKKKQDVAFSKNTRAKTNAPSTSNALVPFRPKPTISKKAIPMPSAPHEDVTKSQKHEIVSTTKSGRLNSKPIPTNPRWQEFPTVIEEAIDIILTPHNFRTGKEVDLDKKAQMRSGILDIILFEVTAIKASNDRNLGVTTVRKYSRDVKILLESVLGNDVADEEFFGNLKDKENITLDELKEAINKYKKENIFEKPVETISTKSFKKSKKTDLNKSKSLTEKRPPPIQAKKSKGQQKQRVDPSVDVDAPNIVAALPRKASLPNNNKNIVNKHQQRMPAINWGVTKPPTTTNNLNLNNTTSFDDDCDSSNNKSLMMTTFQNNNPMLLTGANIERKPLKGTKEELKKEIKEGADSTFKKMLTNFDIPIELFRSGYILLSRFFKVEEAELLDDEDE
uniref:PHD-type domain-containing protein n=1 Tax=Meloidogyne hapla TaxID=6305 RepID=A0A1I8B8M4_MELHA